VWNPSELSSEIAEQFADLQPSISALTDERIHRINLGRRSRQAAYRLRVRAKVPAQKRGRKTKPRCATCGRIARGAWRWRPLTHCRCPAKGTGPARD
jgi:hypothetical protein